MTYDCDNCDSVWDLLSAYADGETSTGDSSRVLGHVADCESCARDLKFMQRTACALASEPEVEPPAALRDAILAATIYRPRWQDRALESLRRTLGGAPAGRLALAGAAAALVFAAFLNAREGAIRPPDATVNVAVREPQPGRLDSLPALKPEAPTQRLAAQDRAAPSQTNQPAATGEVPLQHLPAPGGRIVMASAHPRLFAPKPAAPRPSGRTAARPSAAPRSEPHLNPETLEMPSDLDERMAMEMAMNEPMRTAEESRKTSDMKTDAAETAAPVAAPKGLKIVLAASTDPLGPGGAVSLADIRKDLVRQRSSVFTSSALRSSERGQLTVGLIRTSF